MVRTFNAASAIVRFIGQNPDKYTFAEVVDMFKRPGTSGTYHYLLSTGVVVHGKKAKIKLSGRQHKAVRAYVTVRLSAIGVAKIENVEYAGALPAIEG